MISLCALASAQTLPERKSSTINGHSGELSFARLNGRMCLDLEDLVRISSGSVKFLEDMIEITIPEASASDPHPSTRDSVVSDHGQLSRDFVKASIEVTAEIREWTTAQAYLIENGYGVTEHFVADQRGQADRALKLAEATALTHADKNAMQLINHEFNAVGEWSEKLFKAQKSMDTAKYSVAPDTLRNEPSTHKIISCGRFLERMLAGGEYQDDVSCH